MNLILFEPDEVGRPLPLADPRAAHILTILRRKPGEGFDAGVIDRTRGRGMLRAVTANALEWTFEPAEDLPPLPSTTLLVGLPRPQSARDILRDATTLGATALHFVATARSDPNYASSSLWLTGEWRRCLCAGAAQAFDPRLPEVTWRGTLAHVLAELSADPRRYALDNYEAGRSLAGIDAHPNEAVHLALGPERGWTAADRNLLHAHGFEFLHLGPRVLRIETAVVAALTLLAARRGAA